MWCLANLFLLLLTVLVQSDVGVGGNSNEISRDDFPKSFVFGAGTSAFQVGRL